MSLIAPRPRNHALLMRSILALAWVALVLVAIGFWYHRRFVATLTRTRAPTWLVAGQGAVPPELMRRVGYLSNGKRSSFLAKPERKPGGVRRICAFGDSFTHGDEVDDRNDYPTLLQQELDRRAPGRFEVVNFGVSSYGFHQAFMLWDALGGPYGCEEVLLGPATFFPDRDMSFNHAGLGNPYYLHARYVLDGDGVRLVEVSGASLQERFEEYVRFVPHLDYARYDRAPPAFLRALLGPGKTVPNPFYYFAGDMRDEARETYRRLLGRIVDGGATVRLGISRDANGPLDGVEDARVDRFAMKMPQSFPYVAPHGHMGPIGNQLVARQFAQRIAPGHDESVPVLHVTPMPSGPERGPETRQPLSGFADAHIEVAGAPVGLFVWGDQASKRRGATGLLQGSQVATLVHVGGPPPDPVTGGSILDGCFLPSKMLLKREPRVCLRAFRGDAVREICDGRIRFPDPALSLGVLEIDGATVQDVPVADEENRLVLTPQSPALREVLLGASRLTITIDGAAALTGVPEPQGRFRLSPGSSGCLRIRASESGLVDVAALPADGTIDLVLQGGRSADVRVPLARWRKMPLPDTGATPGA